MRHCAKRLCAAALALGLAFLLPFSAFAAAEAQVEVDAEAYVVMDAETGQVVAEKNPHLAAFPASITKILTLGLTLARANLATDAETLVPVSQQAVDALIPRASQVALQSGEQVPLIDLLYATMIESANDASHALAEYISGSMDNFAALMNEQVALLGLSGSHFTNPSGQPADDHTTTAYDMAQITRWALTQPGFRQFFSAVGHTATATNLQPVGREFHSANLLLMPYTRYHCEGVTGSKTGYTDAAQYTMVTSAKRGDTEFICVVLKCATNEAKYNATNTLLDYAFGNFRRVTFPAADIGTASLPVCDAVGETLGEIQLHCAADTSFLLHTNLNLGAVRVELELPDRYVVGEPFAPVAVLSLPGNWSAQSGPLAQVPLAHTGLDELLAAASPAAGAPQPQAEPVSPLWLIAALPLLLFLMAAARVLYVRHRRKKRRLARLMAARSQMPVRIAPRPQPARRGVPQQQPARTVYHRAAPRPSAAPARASTLRVAQNPYAAAPRRVGRAR